MSFVLEKILKGIRKDFKVYLVLFIELVLCFSLTFLAINQWFIRQERDNVIETQTLNRIFIDNKSHRTLNSKDLLVIESSLKDDETLIYMQKKPISILKDNSIRDLNTYIVNEGFIDQFLQQRTRKHTILSTHKSLVEDLKQNKISMLDFDLSFNNHRLMLNKKEIEIQTIANIKPDFVITSSQQLLDFPLNNALFIPAETYLEDLNPQLDNGIEMIAIDYSNRPRQEVISELNQVTHNKYKLGDKQVLEQYKSGTDDLTEMIEVFGFCGIVSLLIVCVGIIGLFYIFMNQRKKSIRVSRLFGASKAMIFLEIFLEVFLIIMTASLLSGLIVYIIQPYLSSVYFELYMTSSSLVTMLIAPFIISAVTMLMMRSDVNEMFNLA